MVSTGEHSARRRSADAAGSWSRPCVAAWAFVFTVLAWGLGGLAAQGEGNPDPGNQVPGNQVPGNQVPGDQDPGEELRRMAAVLREPGPEAAAQRLGVIHALLLRDDLPAHAVLQEAVRDPQTAPGCPRTILDNLALRIGQPADPVFGGVAARRALMPGWMAVLVGLFVEDVAVAVDGPDRAALRAAAMDAVRKLGVRERATLLDAVAGPDASLPLRVAALRVAGESRDVTLAAWIAARLDQSELHDAASAALSRLTFSSEPIVDQASFERWHAAHGRSTYLELAERAALDAQRVVAEQRAEADAAFVAMELRLARALARTRSPDWQELGRLCTEERGMRDVLQVLCEEFGARVLGGEVPGGVLQDRSEFVTALESALKADGRPGLRALRLELLAYVALDAGEERPDGVLNRLRAGLQSEDLGVRRAALRGLRRFPSRTGRAWIVETAQQAVDQGDAETLGFALDCLRAPGSVAPSSGASDRAAWSTLLRGVLGGELGDGLNGLGAGLRSAALEVAILRDPERQPVAELFEVLVDVVRDRSAPIALRKLTLPRLALFAVDEPSGEEYVAALLGLLDGSDATIRRLAVEELREPPQALVAEAGDWGERIVGALSGHVLLEEDERVDRAMIDTLLAIAGDPAAVDGVVGAFVTVARNLAAVEDSSLHAWRRQLIVDALRVLALDPRMEAEQLLRVGEGLVALRARDALVELLARPELGRPDIRDGAAVTRARLVLETARLAPRTWEWQDREAEAPRVLAAVASLAARPDVELPLEFAVLEVEARCATGDAKGTLTRADELRAGATLSSRLRARVDLAAVCAHLRVGDLAAAAAVLRSVEAAAETSSDLVAPAADLALELARARLAADEAPAAVQLLARQLPRVVEDPSRWRRAFLLWGEARLLAEGPTPALRAEFERQAERFGVETVPEAERSRFGTLLDRLREAR